jgi:hypothetical protein
MELIVVSAFFVDMFPSSLTLRFSRKVKTYNAQAYVLLLTFYKFAGNCLLVSIPAEKTLFLV